MGDTVQQENCESTHSQRTYQSGSSLHFRRGCIVDWHQVVFLFPAVSSSEVRLARRIFSLLLRSRLPLVTGILAIGALPGIHIGVGDQTVCAHQDRHQCPDCQHTGSQNEHQNERSRELTKNKQPCGSSGFLAIEELRMKRRTSQRKTRTSHVEALLGSPVPGKRESTSGYSRDWRNGTLAMRHCQVRESGE